MATIYIEGHTAKAAVEAMERPVQVDRPALVVLKAARQRDDINVLGTLNGRPYNVLVGTDKVVDLVQVERLARDQHAQEDAAQAEAEEVTETYNRLLGPSWAALRSWLDDDANRARARTYLEQVIDLAGDL